jgi:polyhydroxybutyrate depolymerase
MRWGLPLVLAVLALLAVTSARAVPACGPVEQPCALPNGFYFAEKPAHWDGKSPLPVLVHFHGFREQAIEVIGREGIRDLADRLGVLLVVPQGEGQTWSHPGSPASLRDEFAFVETLLQDLRQRFKLDEERLWASGFSQGASMVWALACYRGGLFQSYLPISGAFWRPEPEQCPTLSRSIRHIHGLKDVTVPLEGRPIRGGKFHQGRVAHAVSLARTAAACQPEKDDDFVSRGTLMCRRPTGCSAGTMLEFCLHSGGHDFDQSWLEETFRPLLRNAADTALKR